MPSHVACSSHQYLPAPQLQKIIVTIAKPRNASKLITRAFDRGCFSSVSFTPKLDVDAAADALAAGFTRVS